MINCNQPNCKHHKTCNLKTPMTPLTREINYWLNQLHKAQQNLRKYQQLHEDIQNHKYSYTVNVYGHIEYAPKQNIFGVTIQRPEHIHYGWNLNKLLKMKDDLTEKVRRLRAIEYKGERL